MIEIERIVLGDFETNCYVVRPDPADRRCWIIDPGFSAEVLLDWLRAGRMEPQKILLTHGHCDHIAGVETLRRAYDGLPVCIGGDDAGMLGDPQRNLSLMTGWPLQLQADELLHPGDVLHMESLEFSVLPTPGHTPGGISFYAAAEKRLFCGDCLFAGSIGRHDFLGGSLDTLLESIRQRLLVLPDETIVYPGHGPQTTIGQEKRENPFVC
ncbi:MAG: MBL fold metallo-hydrolase [Sedimentisphaerales bacterium]|nr:MBL fold metallo-hydrolase [Sedimentisphaerales bacterium]